MQPADRKDACLRGELAIIAAQNQYTCVWLDTFGCHFALFFFFQSPRSVMKERNPRPAATPIQTARGRQCRGVPAESEHCAGTVSETQIMATERQDNRHPSCCSQAPQPFDQPPPPPKTFDRTRKSNKTPTCFPFKTDHVRGSTNLKQCSQHICLRSVNQHVHCWPLQKRQGASTAQHRAGWSQSWDCLVCSVAFSLSASLLYLLVLAHIHIMHFCSEQKNLAYVCVCIFIIACLHSKHPNWMLRDNNIQIQNIIFLRNLK